MKKFLAVVRHEYKKVVFKWAFVIGTLLFPLIAVGFSVIPALLFSIKSEPTRVAIYDQTGKIAPRLKANLSAETVKEKSAQAAKDSANIIVSQDKQLNQDIEKSSNNFKFVDYNGETKTLEQVRRELGGKIAAGELDAYLIVPQNYDQKGEKFEFYSRRADDFVANRTFEDAINKAVYSQRLADSSINEDQLKSLSQNVDFAVKKVDEKGAEKDSTGSFLAGLLIAFMIYLILIIYGQSIMSSIIEEKETRVAEILFSSAKPFELMMGKLVGVGLAGLTQFAIWVGSAAIAVGVAIPYFSANGFDVPLPAISLLAIVYFLIYFLLGFFIYASIYALIGSMVTSVQEGGQFAMLPITLLIAGFYFSFVVIRDPNSTLSFWASIAPFIAPVTMPVRIIAEIPPLWQILLSMSINALTIVVLVWLASRVYRVGMLMYGKRATIPEVWRWIWQK